MNNRKKGIYFLLTSALICSSLSCGYINSMELAGQNMFETLHIKNDKKSKGLHPNGDASDMEQTLAKLLSIMHHQLYLVSKNSLINFLSMFNHQISIDLTNKRSQALLDIIKESGLSDNKLFDLWFMALCGSSWAKSLRGEKISTLSDKYKKIFEYLRETRSSKNDISDKIRKSYLKDLADKEIEECYELQATINITMVKVLNVFEGLYSQTDKPKCGWYVDRTWGSKLTKNYRIGLTHFGDSSPWFDSKSSLPLKEI